jgi:ankyrin repeat protein
VLEFEIFVSFFASFPLPFPFLSLLLRFPLQNLIYIEVEDEDEEEEGKEQAGHARHGRDDSSDSSSDDNDSTAAAHAAAVGHSPQPIKPLGSAKERAHAPEVKAESAQDALRVGGLENTEKAPEKTDGNDTAHAAATVDANGDAKKEERKETATHDESPSPMEVVQEAQKSETKEEPPSPMEVVQEANKKPAPEPLETKLENGGGEVSPRIKKKLELNPEIHLNERDEDENTALHVAILARKLEHVKVLLEAGASFRLRCDGSWPLHTAISMGSIAEHRQFAYECTVVLHEHGADLTAKDDSAHTPLYLACMSNLPQIASYILSDDDGLSSLNTRADRAGNRPLHAAAKFDTIDNPSCSKTAVASATGLLRPVPHHHPDGSVVNSLHSIPGFAGKPETTSGIPPESAVLDIPSAPVPSTEALMTQVLLGTTGIEVDALNVMGRTPIHIACSRGNWSVVRLLLLAGASTTLADRRGFTPGQLAYKRGMPIPNDLLETLGDPPESGTMPPPRDLIVDPNGSTMLLCHELCLLHRTCPPIRRNSSEPPPENVRRLHVLVDPDSGILRTGEFRNLAWNSDARRAAISDVLKVRFLSQQVVMLLLFHLTHALLLLRSTITIMLKE